MRTFIALELPESFRAEVAAMARQLQDTVKGRYVSPENYHLTLAFLGDVSQRNVDCAIEALEAACGNMQEVQLVADGLGKFGKARDATLWLGLRRSDGIELLAQRVREELAARDVPFDSKSFKAHITIARRALVPAGNLPALPFPEPDTAFAVTLFKSELTSDGPIYQPLHTVNLRSW